MMWDLLMLYTHIYFGEGVVGHARDKEKRPGSDIGTDIGTRVE